MAYVGEALVAELALMGRGRRPPDPTPNPTSDSDPPAAPHRIVWPLTESCGPSQNRCIRMAHGDPAQSPPDPRPISLPRESNYEAKGRGRAEPAPPKERGKLAGEPLAPGWEGDWVQLRGWGVKRGVAMSHDIL